jgi:prolyl-tRNA synthetase
MTKIENILRQEIDAIGGQEVTMPVVHSADLWKETHRWYEIGSEMGRFKDKSGRDMVLAMTHEEVVADLVRNEIQSYRQLPCIIYHIQTKWRDDPRPRAGLIRVREFTMKDSYTLDADWEGLDKQYRDHYQAYFNIFNRCAVPSIAVVSDVGMMGGKMAHEFMYLTPVGEDTLLLCDSCGYTANRHIAHFNKPIAEPEDPEPLAKIETPDVTTIKALAEFLDIPGRIPRHPRVQNSQSHLYGGHHQRGPEGRGEICLRGGAGGYGSQRDQADQRGQSQGTASGAGRRDPGHWRRAWLWVSDGGQGRADCGG